MALTRMQPDITTRLKTYQGLLLKWQKTVNLVSASTLEDAWERHFEDSLQLLDFIPEDTKMLADIGSGAGFPGLVIGIARPELQVHLVESDTRKAAFLTTVSRETNASNVMVHAGRAEHVLQNFSAEIVTARALAALPLLLELTRPQKAAKLLFLKGANWRAEIDQAKQSYDFEWAVKPSKTALDGVILCITGVAAKA